MKYYLEENDAVLSELRTDRGGLSSADAEKRLNENGRNKLHLFDIETIDESLVKEGISFDKEKIEALILDFYISRLFPHYFLVLFLFLHFRSYL